MPTHIKSLSRHNISDGSLIWNGGSAQTGLAALPHKNIQADNGDFLYAYLQKEVNPENFKYPNQVVPNWNFTRVVNATDDAWLGGVLRNGSMVLFPLDLDVDGLYAIKCEGIEKKVTFIENKYDAYWGVALEDSQDIMTFGYPANIELIYK